MNSPLNVTNVTDASERFMRRDLMRSGLVAEDFPVPPKPLVPTDEGQSRYRLWYDLDYYKDRIDRLENKYLGPKNVSPAHVCIGSQTDFNSGHMNASCEGLKKCVLFELVTGIPTMAMDHCWDFGEGDDSGEDGAASKSIRLDILDGLRPGKVHIAMFDGDWATNPNVARALATYALELDGYGVQARFPDFGTDAHGEKQGFDDWFIAKYGTDRETWPRPQDVVKELFKLPQVPVTELEEAKKWALATVDRFNRSHTDLSDRGNATLLIRLLGRNNLRYLRDTGEWIHWNGSRWINVGTAPTEMTNVVARYYFLRSQRLEVMAQAMPSDEAHQARKEALMAEAKAKHKWASEKCSSVPGRMAMLKDASARPILWSSLSAFDQDGDLLGLPNGVVNLKTGEVRPEAQEDLISKHCAVPFTGVEPTGEGAARARRFVEDITAMQHGRVAPDRQQWLQRRIGAALRGRNALEGMEIWHGKGANGKSVLAKSLMAALGPYAAMVPAGALLTSSRGRDAEGASPFMVRAVGTRLVFASETSDTAYLDEPRVKLLTGGDKLNVRGNYQDGGEYAVTFTLVLLTNPLPNVAEGDAALWDRLAPFPFLLRWRRPGVLAAVDAEDIGMPEADPWLKDVMAEGGDAGSLEWLLWWAIWGGVAWQEDGLGDVPEDLRRNAEAYRGAQDKMGRWMDDCEFAIVGAANGSTSTTELFRSYSLWCEQEGTRSGTASTFAKRLIEYSKGFVEAGKSNGVRILKGVISVKKGGKRTKFDIE